MHKTRHLHTIGDTPLYFKFQKRTFNLTLSFRSRKPILIGYIDIDIASDLDTRKSTLGYVNSFVCVAISWQS